MSRWLAGCLIAVVLAVLGFIGIVVWGGWSIVKGVREEIATFPQATMDAKQVRVSNPSNHPLTNVTITLDAITRKEPTLHHHFTIHAGTIAPHATFSAPLTRAKSDSGKAFNPAHLKVWSVTAQGGAGSSSSWSTTASDSGDE